MNSIHAWPSTILDSKLTTKDQSKIPSFCLDSSSIYLPSLLYNIYIMRHAPLWVLSYRNKQRKLRQLHSALKQQDASPVFDTSCKHIELHPMNFMTGQIIYGEEEVGPMFTHFAPNPHVVIPDSLEDCFTKSRDNRNTKSNNGDIITPNASQLFESFERRSRISRPRPQQESRWYPAS